MMVFEFFWRLGHSFYEIQDGGNCFNLVFGKTRGQKSYCSPFPYYATVLFLFMKIEWVPEIPNRWEPGTQEGGYRKKVVT